MLDKKKAKQDIQLLLDKYKRITESGEIKNYNEENTKKDFILPLFEILGWDTSNKMANEVIAEERVSNKRVDYAFKINEIPQFYLEAKSLSEYIDDRRWFDQAVTYAYNKSVTWVILSNFKKTKIINAEKKATVPADIQYFEIEWKDYVKDERLFWLSKESFLNNVLDEKAEFEEQKIPKRPVSERLFTDLTSFREILSKNISKNNREKQLTAENIEESVQKILSRLIFIRMLEDRQYDEIKLKPISIDKKLDVNSELKKIFSGYYQEYKSGLFEPHLCDELKIAPYPLRTVIERLYESEDQMQGYDFGIMDADILGGIYEQYLSYIVKTSKKGIKLNGVDYKKKREGIFYTPRFVVEFMMKQIFNELVSKNIDFRKLKFLDASCGSGSFVIKIFDYISKGILEQQSHGVASEELQNLSYEEKVKIIEDNIYGVDKDPKAVEIAKLNLFLKIAEKKRALPTLRHKIKCGDSIIEDRDVDYKKAFKWRDEFPEVVTDGMFDVIIGNPPYVRQEELSSIKPYLESNYDAYDGKADLYVYFFEKSLKLLRNEGIFCFIVSNKWLKTGYGTNLRKILSEYWIESFIDFGDIQIFEGALTYPCIIFIKKIKQKNPKIKACVIKTEKFHPFEYYVNKNQFFYDQNNLDPKGWNIVPPSENKLLEKIKKNSVSLNEYVQGKIYRGITTGLSKAFVIDEKTKEDIIRQDAKSAEIIRPFLMGKEVRRYGIDSKNKYLIFIPWHFPLHDNESIEGASKEAEATFKKEYPVLYDHLYNYRKDLEKRNKAETGIRYEWYALQRYAASYYKEFDKPKIIYGALTLNPRFSFDTNGYLANNANFFIPIEDKHLLGILNSKVGWYLISNTCTQIKGGYQLIEEYFGNVLITKNKSAELVTLVDRMLSLNKQFLEMKDKLTAERKKLEDEIKKIDLKIDKIVYNLYELTEEEVQIIEKS